MTNININENPKFAPKGEAFEKLKTYWESLKTDEGAEFDQEYTFEAEAIEPMVTYGTNPGMGIKISQAIPVNESKSSGKALAYMGFTAGESLIDKPNPKPNIINARTKGAIFVTISITTYLQNDNYSYTNYKLHCIHFKN